MARATGRSLGSAATPAGIQAARRADRPARSPQTPERSSGPFLTVRHYCQGLGDCHLLRFRKSDGSDLFMLIDCGIHSSVKGGSAKMDEVVADIASVTDRIDILVVTHEHIDHLSAFISSIDQFRKLNVGEVWMAWTENPSDAQARQLDKFKGQALAVLGEAVRRLDGDDHLNAQMCNVHKGISAILGFNLGVQGERVRAGRDAAGSLGKKGIRYLEPSSGVQTLDGVEGLRIYVLGPPRDAALLKITDRDSEMYGLSGAASPLIAAMQGAFGVSVGGGETLDDFTAPFDVNMGVPLDEALSGSHAKEDDQIGRFLRDHYSGPVLLADTEPKSSRRRRAPDDANLTDQAWRRIDKDWLLMSSTLAMQLDDRTNNTSLVLAFEETETGRVMLFAADAQIGSWLSWEHLRWETGASVVTGPDLLARTVYYKVGHHGSQNATAKSKGLQLMTSSDLSAFIPTNKADAVNVGWGEMPFHGIVDDLQVRTQGRTVRADDPWLVGDVLPEQFSVPSGSLKAVRFKKGLWVEFDLG